MHFLICHQNNSKRRYSGLRISIICDIISAGKCITRLKIPPYNGGIFLSQKEEQMLLNTNDTAEFVELSRNFHQWYGANPEKTISETGLLNGDILIPVTAETLARLYDERLLTPNGKSKKVVTPDELAFCERLKVIGDAHKSELLQAQEIIMSRKEK